MTQQIPEFAAQIATSGAITAEDILTLRRSVWADGAINSSEAAAIFAINDLIATPIPDWSAFFVEALSTWLVDPEQPRGFIDETKANWLIDRITASSASPHSTECQARDEIELLVHCLEKSDNSPANLVQFATSRIEAVLLAGNSDAAPRLTEADVQLLRRLIFAPGTRHPGSVGRAEAELLFRLKDATLGADNAPGWQELFVQGVGNYLQGFAGAAPLSRERELELEDFINRPAAGIGQFFERMAQSRPAAVRDEVQWASKSSGWFGRKVRGPGVAPGTVVNFAADKPLVFDPDLHKRATRAIDQDQQTWLDRHIQADQQIDPLERALLAFLKTA